MFNVTSFQTDATGIIYTCQWTYSNADGSVGGTHTLVAPGDNIIPIEEVTSEIVTGWVVDALQNTPEEFDAQIAREKAEREANEVSVVYIPDENGGYTQA